MSRSRINLTLDDADRIMIVRYFGEIDGDTINDTLIEQLQRVDVPWTYDTIIDMRRYESTVLVGEIEELSQRWNRMAQGRDRGFFTAIVSTDPLVKARLPVTQALFPVRILANFDSFDDALDWIHTQRGYLSRAIAV